VNLAQLLEEYDSIKRKCFLLGLKLLLHRFFLWLTQIWNIISSVKICFNCSSRPVGLVSNINYCCSRWRSTMLVMRPLFTLLFIRNSPKVCPVAAVLKYKSYVIYINFHTLWLQKSDHSLLALFPFICHWNSEVKHVTVLSQLKRQNKEIQNETGSVLLVHTPWF
jgi:hypothetical protein